MAKALGVKKSTTYQWIKNQEEHGKDRGGRRYFKITNEPRVFMEQSIERNPKITLQELKQILQNEHKIDVSTEC